MSPGQTEKGDQMEWAPITRPQLDLLVEQQLCECSPELRQLFDRHRVSPYRVPIRRGGGIEQVFVVAEFDQGLLYFEDIEDGFEIDRLDATGVLPNRWATQYELTHILTQLAEGMR